MVISAGVSGQFNINAAGTDYTQDFNTLTAGPWIDNSTLTGWYAKTDVTSSITTYGQNTGSTTTAGLYAFGVAGTNPLTDRALGYAPSNAFTGNTAVGKGYLGWRLKNNTGSDITSLTVTWTGEQWRKDNTVDQFLTFEYQEGSNITNINVGTWTNVPALNFTSPIKTAGATALDGNAPANRIAGISAKFSVSIPAGEEIMLRWSDLNDSGNDHFLAVDDVVINAEATLICTAPVLSTLTSATFIATTGSTLNGDVTTTGGGTAITERGFEYATSSGLVSAAAITAAISTTGTYSVTTGLLVPNSLYYYRAYAINNCAAPQTGYSHTTGFPTFTTLHNAPNVGTGSAPGVGSFTANWSAPSGTVGAAPFTYEIQVDDDNAFGSVNFTKSNISGTNVSATGLSSSTTYYYRIRAVNAGGNSGWSAISPGIATSAPLPAPVVTAASPDGTVGIVFSYNITATNSPTSYSAGTLPAGLTLNTSTGEISGTPTTAGSFVVSVTASNGTTSAPVNFNFTIAKGSQNLICSPVTVGLPGSVSLAGYITNSSGINSYTYVIADPLIATESGGTLTAVAAGTTPIAVTAAGNSNYNTGSGTLTVTVSNISYPNNSFLSIKGAGLYSAASSWSKCGNVGGCTGTTNGAGSWGNAGANGSPTATSTIFVQGDITDATLGITNATVLSGGILTTIASGNYPVSSSLTVKTGGKLNINSNLNFSNSAATFTVEDNADVFVNSYTTNPNTSLWNGVEIFAANSNFYFNYGRVAIEIFTPEATISTNPTTSAKFGNLIIQPSTLVNTSANWTGMFPSGTYMLTKKDFTVTNNGSQHFTFDGGNITVGGNMTVNVNSTGDVATQSISSTGSLTVNGSLTKNGIGIFRLNGGGNFTLNVNGDILINNGTFRTGVSISGSIITTVNLKGDLSAVANSVLDSNNSNPVVNFNFTAPGDGLTPATTQTIDIATTVANENKNILFNVKPTAYVKLINRDFELGTNSKLTVESTGILDFGINGTTALNVMPVSGQTSQSFTTVSGSVLKITSPYGITDAAAALTAGNVQTPVAGRTYHADATYHYIGKGNQVSGNGLPSTASAKKVIVEMESDQLNFWATPANTVKRFNSSGELKIMRGTVLDGQNPDIPAENYGRFSNEVDAGATALQSGKLTMTGGRYLVYNNTYPAPNLSGDYNFTGGVIQFDGNSQSIRAPKSYLNVEVTGVNVGTPGGNITLLTNGTLTVKNGGEFTINANSIVGDGTVTQTVTVENGGLFRTGDADGFSGSNQTSIQPSIPTILLADGSTVEYSRGGDQKVTSFKPLAADESNLGTGGYYNLKITGDNTGGMTAKTIEKTTDPVYVRNTLQIENPAFLKIEAAKAIIIKENITNNGSMLIESDGNLLQKNDDAVFTGNPITAKRNLNLTTERQQYNYLISPLEGYGMKDIYKDGSGNPIPVPFVLYHSEATNKFYTSTGAYIKGRGLAVKEPAVGSVTAGATFVGKPMNGLVTFDIVNGNSADPKRGYNLTGNPYPSNMDLIAFYLNNGGAAGKLSSTFYFWDNKANNQTVQGGSNYEGQAYATFNVDSPPTGGTGTLATGDTAALQGTNKPTRYVKTGQGFMVRTTAPAMTLQYKNSVRTYLSGANSFFGKNEGKEETPVDRFWLNMISPAQISSNIAVVYFPEGNNLFTRDDSRSMGGSDALYSMVDEEKVSINGRSSFVDTDVVSLGSRHFSAGIYRIELADKEGVFANGQNIYLKDHQTSTVTNLSEGPYTFSATAGESSGRFEIIYQPETVLAATSAVKENMVVYRDGDSFVVKSAQKISVLEVYDAAGRLMILLNPAQKEVRLDAAKWMNGMYILKASLRSEVAVKKIRK